MIISKNKIFKWQGLNDKAQKCNGILQALTKKDIVNKLQENHITIIKIKRCYFTVFQRFTKMDVKTILQQLSVMLMTEVPLVKGLQLIQTSTNKNAIKLLLQAVCLDIINGLSLSASLAKYPRFFDRFTIHMIKCGESISRLDQALSMLVIYIEKRQHLVRSLRKIFIYPTIVLGSFLATALIFLIYIIPQFKILYMSFGKKLPACTEMILALSDVICRFGYLLPIFIIVIFLGFLINRKSQKFMMLRTPYLQNFIDKINHQRIIQTLSTCLQGGLHLTEACSLLVNVTKNPRYRLALRHLYEDLRSGFSFHQAVIRNKVFPDLVSSLIATGEESGKLTLMLQKISLMYEQEIDDTITLLSKLLEPILVLGIGGIIGFFVVTMYLPIFKLGSL